jgi:hypothetical protein
MKVLNKDYGVTLVEIMSFATSHYAIGMQLVVVCNYQFNTIYFLGHRVVCATNMQLNVYNMDMFHKNNGLN